MSEPIDFYFDFASPYGFFASLRIDGMAAKHGRTVTWRPILLGAVFKIVGTGPLVNYPLKGDYMQRDLPRTARQLGIPFQLPPGAPHGTVPAARAFYWLHDRNPETAKAFAQAIYGGFFTEGRDVSSPDAAVEAAAGLGVDRAEMAAALQDAEVKDRLRREVEAAIARGVFGSPFIFVDGEPFWGSDRLNQVEEWLQRGGW